MQLVCNTRSVMVALSSEVTPSQNANKLLAIPDVRAFPLYCSDEHRDSILNEHRQCQLDSKQPSLKGSGVFCKINCSQFQIKGIITPRKQCRSILPESSFFRESRKMWKSLSLNFLADIETVCCSLKKVPLEVQCQFLCSLFRNSLTTEEFYIFTVETTILRECFSCLFLFCTFVGRISFHVV